jgi:hypothetical protein
VSDGPPQGVSHREAHPGQDRSASLTKRQVLQVLSSVVQACMPWRAASRKEQRDETAGGGLKGLEPGQDSAGPAKLIREGQ